MTKELIEKSKTDYKEYRIITLKNKLKAVLISDLKPEPNNNDNDDDENDQEEDDNDAIQKSAAALCINVGSFNDPFELQGLAHYLEHMVFMGSEKYPTENDFDACVSQHGGCTNAWTDAERTLFYFDSHFKQFESILDKFANFFVSPLLLKDSMNREVTAVNSEFEMGYSNDTQRIEYLLQTLSKVSNPYRIFSCGNTKSLKDDPTTNQIDIYRYLQNFRQNMYSSHWMTLAVQSRDTLDNIETMVRKIFSDIPCNNLPKCDMSKFVKPFDTAEFNKIYHVVPVRDVKSLKLTWSLPSILSHYKSKPLHILGHLVGYEGHGSLTAYLRQMNYIVELEGGNANGGFDASSFNSLFIISVRLTDLGFERVAEVIEAVFSYLNILREGIPERIFREYQQIKKNEFLYKEASEPVQNVENLAANLQLFESEHIISGSDLVYEYNPRLYEDMLKEMTVDRVNIMVMSQSFEQSTQSITEWYDVKYSSQDITEQERCTWKKPAIIDGLHLPAENKFLATNFDVLDDEEKEDVPVDLTTTIYPELKVYGELWHQVDSTFKVPKAIVNFYLRSSKILESAKSECLCDLVIYAVNQQLSIVAYDASVAGIDYKVSRHGSGIAINTEGFNDKLPLLFTTIIDVIGHLKIDATKLSVYKESLRQIYKNQAIKADKLVKFVRDKILFVNEWIVTEKLSALKDVLLEDFVDFLPVMFDTAVMRAYFHGNITEEKASFCANYAINTLHLKPHQTYKKNLLRQLPVGTRHARVMGLNPSDVNIAVMVDYQLGHGSIRQQAINEFLTHVLSEPCFDYLRTKETLGYSVGMYESQRLGVLGQCIFVMGQANKFSLDHCRAKIDHFFQEQVVPLLAGLSEEDFGGYKDSFVANKLIEDIQMSDVESRNWREIVAEEYIFDRRYRHVEYVEPLTKVELEAFVAEYYLNGEGQRRLVVEVDAATVGRVVWGPVDADMAEGEQEVVAVEMAEHMDGGLDLFDLSLAFVEPGCKCLEEMIGGMSLYEAHKIDQ